MLGPGDVGNRFLLRGACAPLAPCKHSKCSEAQSSRSTSVRRTRGSPGRWCARMAWGFMNNLRWEEQWDLRGAASFLEQVSPQLGWGARRRVRLAGLTVLGKPEASAFSRTVVTPGFASLLSWWDDTAFSLATRTISCKTDQTKWKDSPIGHP